MEPYDFDSIEEEDFQIELPKKKKSVVWDVMTVQAIICVLLVVILLFVNLFQKTAVDTAKAEYRQIVSGSDDWWDSIVKVFGQAIDAITKRPAEEKDTTGAGGEPNPFGPYNRVMAPPDDATFAPFIFTSTITPPIKGLVTSLFGYRYHPVTKELDFHKGIDVAAPAGTPILAAVGGTVLKTGENNSAGKYLTISHGNGLTTTYMHCSAVIAKKGAVVREGEVIAKVGSTGMSTGNHLHFQMEKDGILFDPSWVVSLTE